MSNFLSRFSINQPGPLLTFNNYTFRALLSTVRNKKQLPIDDRGKLSRSGPEYSKRNNQDTTLNSKQSCISSLNTRRASPVEIVGKQPQRFRDAYLLTEKIRRLLDKSTERATEAW